MAAKYSIPPEIIEEVRSRNNIVDVISECGVALRQVGSSYKALCPFHEEKTPSFFGVIRKAGIPLFWV